MNIVHAPQAHEQSRPEHPKRNPCIAFQQRCTMQRDTAVGSSRCQRYQARLINSRSRAPMHAANQLFPALANALRRRPGRFYPWQRCAVHTLCVMTQAPVFIYHTTPVSRDLTACAGNALCGHEFSCVPKPNHQRTHGMQVLGTKIFNYKKIKLKKTDRTSRQAQAGIGHRVPLPTGADTCKT